MGKTAPNAVWEMGGREEGRQVRKGVSEKQVTDGEDTPFKACQ